MKKYNQQFALELYNIPNVYDYLQTSSMETVKKKKLQIHQTKYKIGLQVVPAGPWTNQVKVIPIHYLVVRDKGYGLF